MTPLLELVIRYGEALQESCNPRKSFAVRLAYCDLAGTLLSLISERIRALEKGK